MLKHLNIEKIIKFLLYALILLMPTQLTKTIWTTEAVAAGLRVDYLAIMLNATDLLLLVLFVASIIQKIKSKNLIVDLRNFVKKNKFVIAIFLTWFCFSVANTATPIFQTIILIRLILLTNLFHLIKDTSLNKRAIASIFILQIFLLCFLSLGQVAKQGSLGRVLYWLGERRISIQTPGIATQTLFGLEFLRPYATFSHPNILSGYILVAFVWLICNFHVRFFNKNLINGLLSVCVLVILLTASSQSAWLAGMATMLFFMLRKTTRLNLNMFYIILISIIVPILLLAIPVKLQNESVLVRNQIYINGMKLFGENLIAGVGWLGNISNTRQLSRGITSIKALQPIHNAPWIIITSLGIPVTIYLLFTNAKTLLKTQFNKKTACVFAIICLSAFDHYWLTQQQTILLFVFTVAWMKKINTKRNEI